MSTYRILEIAETINQLIADLPLGGMQAQRMRRKHGRVGSKRWRLFGRRLISDQEEYIFHYGGSMEFQFNLGEEVDPTTGTPRVRYGLALSYQPTQSIPDPLNSLAGQTARFNRLITERSRLLDELAMTIYEPDRDDESHRDAHPPFNLIRPVRRSFYFIGRFIPGTLQDLTDEDIRVIAYGLNDLLPLYEAVEFGADLGATKSADPVSRASSIQGALRKVNFPEAGGRRPNKLRTPTPTDEVDYAAEQVINKTIGDGGEALVLAYEQQKLIQADRADLAERVVKMPDGTGYDVRSFDINGKELHIEVKTTCSGVDTPFYLSRNEWTYALDRNHPFVIYRLYNFKAEPNSAEFFVIDDPEAQLDLVPEVFRVYRK